MKKTRLLLLLSTSIFSLGACSNESSGQSSTSTTSGTSNPVIDIEMTQSLWNEAISFDGFNGTIVFMDEAESNILSTTELLANKSFHIRSVFGSAGLHVKNFYVDTTDENDWIVYSETEALSDEYLQETYHKNEWSYDQIVDRYGKGVHPITILKSIPYNEDTITKVDIRTWKMECNIYDRYSNVTFILDEKLQPAYVKISSDSYTYSLVASEQNETTIDFSYPQQHLKPSSNKRGPISFWHNFGNNYTNRINESFIDPLLANDDLNVKQEGKGSYDGILAEISYSLSSGEYPNIATGYPDHFSKYSRTGYPESQTGVLVDLNHYLNDASLNEAHRTKYGYTLSEDYYPEYMVENQTIAYDISTDDQLTIGLPFAKQTEVMGYNGVFVDFVKANEATYGHVEVPRTWAEWQEYGPRFRSAQLDLVGKYLNGDQTSEGTASNFSITTEPTNRTLLDFSEVEADKSAVLSWDSMANMFITLVRQYGGTYTSYTAQDRHAERPVDRHGYMEFWSGENKAKTQEAMEMVLSLAGDTSDATKQIFAHPSTFGSLYYYDAFAKNKYLFAICSTGSLSHIFGAKQRFRVAPIPYKDAEHKFVMSQGADIAIFDQECILERGKYNAQEMADMSFEAITKMTTGEYQAKFAAATGFFPTSKSATNSQIYQNYINGTPDYSDKIATAYREGAKLNQTEYMDSAKEWIKFVDPGFEGSAAIRTAADRIILYCIINQQYGSRTPVESIIYTLDGVYDNSDLKKYIRS